MAEQYIISIDQSTQGTKALLFDEKGHLIKRMDRSHEQIVNTQGWVSHNPSEIYANVIDVVTRLTEEVDKTKIIGVGISNQRETSLAWDRVTGEPLGNAIVWQCARAADICERVERLGEAENIRRRTGMNLSPYFPASKIAWILENVDGAKEKADRGEICHGTIDSWLVFKLTGGKFYKTDYSNASRTQLFNIFDLKWDKEICGLFGIDPKNMAEVCDSDSDFGETDFEGVLPHTVPIHGVLGDSHGSLFGQGCLEPGMTKATYGTGSSIMMNVGETPVLSTHGVVTSLAWGMEGKVNYVLEGNLNYTGAVITWLKEDLKLIQSPVETEALAEKAVQDDFLYLVPAFSGLGAPYWDSRATASIVGMNRTTKRAEIVRAGVECIAYQITDIIKAMSQDAGVKVGELRVDGGPTKNKYLMQFQSNIADTIVQVPDSEEFSGIGPAYAAGLALGIWDETIFENMNRVKYEPQMKKALRKEKYEGWKAAVKTVLTK
ncbi:glycerol kinase [Muricomes intestini]|jgi:glycerol kinase|uniref:FGGY-family carbohydrate kinase n=2 Tax=Muricomes intestini TaxID=1796634 RepID=UPI000E8E569E|nr:glycerol kinase [Lachnospiraceae bacterium]HCR84356.1 glycerol kinase [Lachnospiraceae bacterium]